ncbi:suppressor of fused domain protein [Bacillus sp. REN10]|uniref:suppressor of fused domain protein n=1 Tax=Bacillus sp. REN10 TaxID=2782541 RepID=UPI00193C4110|nr:suppressor of fused domain protein [Bacillus sp. REN10]
MEKVILLEEQSPLCPITALVEEANECVYFYLIEDQGEEQNIRAVWVRNYGEAPEQLEVEDMREGLPPLLPASVCAHPNGAEKLDPEKVELIWFEEGDGAALLYEQEVLAVIPGWGGTEQYPGYARDCTDIYHYALPLGDPSENVLFARIEKAQDYWNSWDENSWSHFQTSQLQALESKLGKHTKYYAIDGGYWPPRALVTFEQEEITYAVTLGTSLLSQPQVELYVEEPDKYRRFELALAIPTTLLKKNEQGILQYISAQTSVPWHFITFLAHGHTLVCDEFQTDQEHFSAILLANAPKTSQKISLEPFRGDDINLLWMIPLTEKEYHYAMEHGSEQLLEQMKAEEQETWWMFNGRTKFDI